MLVSILIPCYNADVWVRSAIQSLILQTYNNIEILAYEDGSTDSTGEILNTLAKQDKRIKVFNNTKNNGLVNALNTLVEKSNGTYIARMDADDIAHPQRLEKQLSWIIRQEVDLCGSWFREFGQGLSRTTKWPISNNELHAAMLFQNSICHPTILAKRQVFDEFTYSENYRYVEDYDIFSRIMTKYKVCNLPQPLLKYRRHPNQETQLRMEEMEIVNRKIRLENLIRAGIHPTPEELEAHNKIRSKISITSITDLELIEQWLLSLISLNFDASAKKIIASQWVRACIRAAPLGKEMWHFYKKSELYNYISGKNKDIDIYLLSIARLNYNSKTFNYLKRLGLSS